MLLRAVRPIQFLQFIVGGLLVLGAATSSWASSVVDRAEIRMAEQYADIEIKFNVPISIRNYAPLAHGEILQVGIELPSDAALGNAMQLGATEWIAGSQPSAVTLYEYLRFDREREPNHGRLIIKFLRDVNYSVYRSSDSRSVVISILKTDLPKQRNVKVAAAPQMLPKPEAPPKIVVPEMAVALEAPAVFTPPPLTEVAMPPLAAVVPNPVEAPSLAVEPPLPAPTTNLPVSVTAVAPTVPLPPIANSGPKPLERSSGKNDGWRVYGGVSQYYRYADVKITRSGDPRFNTTDSQTSESDLRTNLDLSARYRSDDWDMRSRFNGGYVLDFLDHSKDTFHSRYSGNRALLSDAYVDLRNRHSDISAKVGRQYGSTGGVFGRIDGAQIGLPVASGLRANVVAGTPVDLTSDKTVDDTNSYFYGANIDIAPKNSRWQYNLYTLQEMIDGIVDRRAVGGETRYYGENRSLLSLLDYDIEYSALNRALLIGTWALPSKTTFNATIDYGYSPLLTTRNALMSQPGYRSIKQLLQTYGENEIKQLARDRTAKYHTISTSVTQEFTPSLQLYGSVGEYYYGAMPASGGVEAMPSTGNEFDYELQLIASGWLQQNDTTSFGLRYYDGNTVRRSAAGIDGRYLFGNWRLNPRLWVELRNNVSDGTDEWVYRPGLRIEYSFLRRYHIELDASSDMYKGKIPRVGNQDIVGNFLQLGYRIDLD